jgi:staphylococcal nuclease domain-containing protein 1
LQIWENYVEGEEINSGPVVESKQKEVLKVVEILLNDIAFICQTTISDFSILICIFR